MLAQMFPGMEWIPVIWLAIILAVVGIIVFGASRIARLLPLRSARPHVATNVRRTVTVLIAVSLLVLIAKSCGPLSGPDPRERISIGMNTDEVRAALGKPHEQYTLPDGTESWIYYTDWFHMGYYSVEIDRDHKVFHQWLE